MKKRPQMRCCDKVWGLRQIAAPLLKCVEHNNMYVPVKKSLIVKFTDAQNHNSAPLGVIIDHFIGDFDNVRRLFLHLHLTYALDRYPVLRFSPGTLLLAVLVAHCSRIDPTNEPKKKHHRLQ